MALYTKHPINGSKQEVTHTLAHFKRSRKMAGLISLLSLAALLFSIYLVIPAFFLHFWLIIPLFLTLIFTKSYGSWDAYVNVRENSEELEVQLANLEELEREVTNAENRVNNLSTNTENKDTKDTPDAE